MRKSTLGVLLSLLLIACPVLAQDQRGSIQGVVKDNSGAVLPGANVEARSEAGAVASTVTDSNGAFRFPSLAPGTYEVTASLQGFSSAKLGDIPVSLGQTKTIELGLAVGGVTEKVQVTAEPPLIDTKQSGRQTTIRAEQIDLLPHNRDFTSLVTQAPGVNLEFKSGNGIMIDGASSAENRYIVDGMETTEMVHGQSGKNVLADFVEEVQIKSTGYPAEFGGSTGGVINVITKSGTDRFSGDVLTYWQGSALQSSPNQTLRLKLTNANQDEYITYPKDHYTRTEPGFAIGGPISKGRAWFYGAYQPSLISTDRSVTPASAGNPNETVNFNQNQKEQFQYIVASQTTQISDKLRTRVAFNNSWRKLEGLLPSQAGTDNPATSYTKGTRNPNWSLSGNADYVLSPSLFVSARIGRYVQDTHDFNVPDLPRFVFASQNLGMPGVPAEFQHPTNYANILTNSAITQDTLTRNFAQFDATWYAHAAGDHQIKGGVQIDRRNENIVSGDQKNTVTLEWGSVYDPTKPTGAFGFYHVRSNRVLPKAGFITQGNESSNLTGLFIQDTWALNSRLTVNLGLRTENENIPAYQNDSTNFLGANPIKFGFGDKLAPRLGFAYDVAGDGKTKVYGSWGIFYDIFKLELPRGSFGGEKWVEYYYTLDTPNFTTLIDGANCPPACPGTFLDSVDERLPSLNPGDVMGTIKPMRSQELSFGFERQLGPTMAFSARYVHKQLDRGIEDTGDIVGSDEHYIIGNPGEGPTATFNIDPVTGYATYAGSSGKYVEPKPTRYYNSMELALEKRISNNWYLRGSYTLSRDHGNYPGLAESDEATGTPRSDPNVGRLFDYPFIALNGKGQPLDGPFATDRTHQVKISALYMFKFGTSVGANQYVASGTPITRVASILAGHNYPLFYNDRGSDGRTPAYFQTDFYIQHELKVGGNRRLVLSMNVLNLFDRRATTDRWPTIRRTGTTLNFDENAFVQGQVNIQSLIDAGAYKNPDPRFLQDFRYQTERQARVGVKFSF
jgi:outer membrane receptor protein involved in Fe transport